MRHFPVDFRSRDSLLTASVCDSDVHKSTRRLRPSKSVGLDDIPAFIRNGCLDVSIPVLKFIFNLNLLQCILLTLWKQAAVVTIFKEGKTVIVNNYRLISIPNTSKIIEIIIHEHVSHHLKSNFNTRQTPAASGKKMKGTVSNVLTGVDRELNLWCWMNNGINGTKWYKCCCGMKGYVE